MTGTAIRTGDMIPASGIDPTGGALHVVGGFPFNGKGNHYGTYDEVAFGTSRDGGASWTAPLRISTPNGKPAFTPSMRANANGTIAVTYYDFRYLDVPGLPLPTDYWVTLSSDGGATFGSEAHVACPFNMLSAPYARGYFVATTLAWMPMAVFPTVVRAGQLRRHHQRYRHLGRGCNAVASSTLPSASTVRAQSSLAAPQIGDPTESRGHP